MGKVNWNQFSIYYDKVSKLEKEYTMNQLDCIDVGTEDTVLDIGCGPGRIAIPIAKRVKSVTALDAYSDMLEICKNNASEEGVDNITTQLLNWNQVDISEVKGKYDVVIASRSLGMVDLKKLNDTAEKMVVIIGWIKEEAPSIGSLFTGVIDDYAMSYSSVDDPIRDYISGYQIAFNEVYNMGALPNVRVVNDGFKRNYKTREHAYHDLRNLRQIPSDKMNLFQENVDKFLYEELDGSITYCCERRSYVLWWNVV